MDSTPYRAPARDEVAGDARHESDRELLLVYGATWIACLLRILLDPEPSAAIVPVIVLPLLLLRRH